MPVSVISVGRRCKRETKVRNVRGKMAVDLVARVPSIDIRPRVAPGIPTAARLHTTRPYIDWVKAGGWLPNVLLGVVIGLGKIDRKDPNRSLGGRAEAPDPTKVNVGIRKPSARTTESEAPCAAGGEPSSVASALDGAPTVRRTRRNSNEVGRCQSSATMLRIFPICRIFS